MSKTKAANKPPSTDSRISAIKNAENAKPIEDINGTIAMVESHKGDPSGLEATATASIDVPMSPHDCGYKPIRCDVGSLSGVQRTALRRITNGLIAKDAKLGDGRRVIKPQDAIKWMLEQVGDA